MGLSRDQRRALAALAAAPFAFLLFVWAGRLGWRFSGGEVLPAFAFGQVAGLLPTVLLGFLCFRDAALPGLAPPRPRALAGTLGLVLGLWPAFWALDVLRGCFFSDPAREAFFVRFVAEHPLPLLLFLLGALPGFLEEGIFRGVLVPVLHRAWGAWPALLLSSVLFAAFHASPSQTVVQGLLGLLLGWLRLRTGSLWPCVLAHALHNGVSALAMKQDPALLQAWPPWPGVAAGLLVAVLAARYTSRTDARA